MKKKNSNKLICSKATIKKIFLFGIFLILICVIYFLDINKSKTTLNEQQLNQEIFLQAAVNGNANLIFFKDDCPYCSAAEQTIVKASKKSKYPAFFVDLDTPEGQALKVKYNVMSLLAIRSPIMPLNAMRVLVQTKTLWCLSIILGILVVYCFSGSKKEGIK